MDPQITWFCPSIDVFYMDVMYGMHRMAQRQTPALKNTVTDGEYDAKALMCWETLVMEFGDLLGALVPVAERIEALLISGQNDNMIKIAMRPGLFPQLKRILFGSGHTVPNNNTDWARAVAHLTQENRHGPQLSSRGSYMCRRLYFERYRYEGNKRGKAEFAGHRRALKTWRGSFGHFETPAFEAIRQVALPDHLTLLERQMALARCYWNTAYTTRPDGSRVYQYYYDEWVCMVYPNSAEVVAFLDSLPDVEQVLLFATKVPLVRQARSIATRVAPLRQARLG